MKAKSLLLAASMALAISCSSDDSAPSTSATIGFCLYMEICAPDVYESSCVSSGGVFDKNSCPIPGQGGASSSSNNASSSSNFISSSSLRALSSSSLIPSSSSGNAANPAANTFRDPRDNTDYKWVQIGARTWMAQNLNYLVSFSNPTLATNWCYNKNNSNCATYGRLYNYDAAVEGCSGLGSGWRLPDDNDWNNLIQAVGGASVAGKNLKSTSWRGTDDFGFSALPGGYRENISGANGGIIDDFQTLGSFGWWWSATGGTSVGSAYAWYMERAYDDVNKLSLNMSGGLSVRCVK